MIGVKGFDEALIGTGLRSNDREVLVYDGYIAQWILSQLGYEGITLVDYLHMLGIDELGPEAPIFVFLDDGVLDESEQTRGRVVH
jgi:hypothetical protein